MSILVGLVVLVAACNAPTPSPSPTASGQPVDVGGLIVAADGALAVTAANGALEPLAGPGEPVRWVSAAGGRLIAETGLNRFHVAELGSATGSGDGPAWRPLEVDAPEARLPLSMPVLSPDGRRVALLAATFGEALPFDVVVADVASGTAEVIPVEAEANSGLGWVDADHLLLDAIVGGGPSTPMVLDLADGTLAGLLDDIPGGTALSEGPLLVSVDDDGSLLVTNAADLAAGRDESIAVATPAGRSMVHVALNAGGDRLAVVYAAETGEPAGIVIYAPDGDAWRPVTSLSPPAADWPVSVAWSN